MTRKCAIVPIVAVVRVSICSWIGGDADPALSPGYGVSVRRRILYPESLRNAGPASPSVDSHAQPVRRAAVRFI